MDCIRFAALCLFGLEGLLADELRELGAAEVTCENGRVLFSGGEDLLCRTNLCLRTAERVEVLLGDFRAVTFDQLYEGVKALPWERWIDRRDAFPVKGWSLDSTLHSVPDCQSIIKKAVVDRLNSRYHISWFEESGAVCGIRFSLHKDVASLMLDTSGTGLHKRGYRPVSSAAPIKETLAAGMAMLSRLYPDSVVYDPFCGSGTLLIESALLARGVAPGINRQFAAEQWSVVPAAVWQAERERARNKERRDIAFSAWGGDTDPAMAALTKANAHRAGVGDCVETAVCDVAAFTRTTPRGVVITNPPYGERLLDIRAAEDLYTQMGRVFEAAYGWRYAIISPHEQFEQFFGRRADKRRKLYNGMIRCQLYMYYKNNEKRSDFSGRTAEVSP